MKYTKQLHWLFTLSRGYRKAISFPILISGIAVLLSLIYANQIRLVIDRITAPLSVLIPLIGMLAGAKLLQFFCEEYESFLRGRLSARLENVFAQHIFTSLFHSNTKALKTKHSGDEMNRITTDVGIVTQCISYTIPSLCVAVLQLLATSAYLICIQPSLTLVILCIMPVMMTLGHLYAKRILPLSRKLRKADAELYETMQESIQKHDIIISFGIRQRIIAKVQRYQSFLFRIICRKLKYETVTESFIDLGFVIGYLGVLIWGFYGIRHGTFTYALLLVFLQLVGQLERPFVMFKSQYPALLSSFASIERLAEIESMEKEKEENPILFSSLVGVEIRKLSFGFNDSGPLIYKDFSYTFMPGTTTAIIGETGIGKTTLFNLMLAHLQPTSGKILIGTDSTGFFPVSAATRPNFTIVPQGNSLLSGSIRYNLRLGNPNATDEQMQHALQMAAADFVFTELPEALSTIVGEQGFGLSEGQAQRIAIARSLLHDAPTMLLDEPTSALDPATEERLLRLLTSQRTAKTIIIISHKKEIRQYVQHVLHISLDNRHK